MSDKAETAAAEETAPAEELTIEERVARQFDDSSAMAEDAPAEQAEEAAEEAETEQAAEADSEQAEPTSEDSVEVEIDGITYQVPAELKEGYIRQADYTRKTKEVAQKSGLVEQQAHALQMAQNEVAFLNSISDEVQQLAHFDSQISVAEGIDWKNLSSDQMFRHKMEIDKLEKSKNELVASLQAKRQAFDTEQEQQKGALIQQADAYLASAIPNWGEETKTELSKHAVNTYSFHPAELAEVTDPRMLMVLHDAVQYRKIQAGTANAVKKAEKAPPVVKPTAKRTMSTDTANKLNYRKRMKAAKTPGEKENVIRERYAQKMGL